MMVVLVSFTVWCQFAAHQDELEWIKVGFD
jgi:hypothetical protein